MRERDPGNVIPNAHLGSETPASRQGGRTRRMLSPTNSPGSASWYTSLTPERSARSPQELLTISLC